MIDFFRIRSALNGLSTFSRKSRDVGDIPVTDTRDHPPSGRGLAPPHPQARDTGGSHLAHWPPPQRGQEVRHAPAQHHLPNEPDQHAKPHGLSLTRSAFKDEADD
jgi:hypothetical protein